jgi:hypothetical protein
MRKVDPEDQEMWCPEASKERCPPICNRNPLCASVENCSTEPHCATDRTCPIMTTCDPTKCKTKGDPCHLYPTCNEDFICTISSKCKTIIDCSYLAECASPGFECTDPACVDDPICKEGGGANAVVDSSEMLKRLKLSLP